MDKDKNGNPIVGISDNDLERCVSAVTGMTKARGESALLMCVSKLGKIDVPTILAEKSAQVNDYGLELHNPDPDDVVGGMQVFQEYLQEEIACSTPKHSDLVYKEVVWLS